MNPNEQAEFLVEATGSAYELFESASVRGVLLRTAAAQAVGAGADPEIDAVDALYAEFDELRALGAAAQPIAECLVSIYSSPAEPAPRRLAALHVLVEIPSLPPAARAISSALCAQEPETVAVAISHIHELPLEYARASKPRLQQLAAAADGKLARRLASALHVIDQREAGTARLRDER